MPRGGKRTGAGIRYGGRKLGGRKTTLYLDDVTRERLKKIGEGDMSLGARRAALGLIKAWLFATLEDVHDSRLNLHPPRLPDMYSDDAYDGECPECGALAIFWAPLEEYIESPSHYACENGHVK